MFYHGSSTGGLQELRPFVSEHKQPYIYFSTNPVVASFYTVHPVEKPYSWYPYGFSGESIPIYSEYYPDGLADVYQGKTGYLYQCANLPVISNPTNINCAVACEALVDVDSCIVLDDVYDFLLKCEPRGEFIIRRFPEMSSATLEWVERMIVSEIETNNLKATGNSYADFLYRRFPKAWERAK